MDSTFIQELPGILAITLSCGGAVLFGVVAYLSTNWRKVRVAEQNAVLKRSMIEKGFSPEQIVKVIEAGTPLDDKEV